MLVIASDNGSGRGTCRARYAVRLSRPGALDAELAGVETGPELRRYGLLQLWIVVPLALVAFALRNRAARRA